MRRIIFLQIVFILFLSSSLLAQSKRKKQKISEHKKIECHADSLLLQEEYSEALPGFYKAANFFEKNKLWLDAVKAYRQTGWCYLLLYNTDSAQYFIDKSNEILTQKLRTNSEEVKFEESEIYYTQARIFLEKEKDDSTLFYLNKGLSILNDLNTSQNSYNLIISKYYQTYGIINYNNGDYNNALKHYLKSLDIKKMVLEQDHPDILSNYYDIADIYFEKCDYEKAIQYLWHIINNCNSENKHWKAKSYNQLGIIAKLKYKYKDAIGFLEKSLKIYKEDCRDSLDISETMYILGTVYFMINDLEKAHNNLKTSLEIRKRNLEDTPLNWFRYFISLGNYYFCFSEYDQSINSFKNALGTLKENNSQDIVRRNDIYNSIGLIYSEQNKFEEAFYYFQLAIAEIIDGFEFEESMNNPELFLENTNTFNKEMKILSKHRLYYNLHNKARAGFHLYEKDNRLIDELQNSFNSYILAFRLHDIIRRDINSDESRYTLSNMDGMYFEEAINVGIVLDSLFPYKNYIESILDLVGRCKNSTVRYNSLSEYALKNSSIPKALVEKREKIAERMAFYKTEIEKDEIPDSTKLNEYKKLYNDLALEHDTILNYFAKTYPQYYNLIHYDNFDIEKIKGEIKKDEIIIEYFVTDSNLFIITLDHNDLELKKVSIDSSFKQNVFKYYRSLRKVEVQNYIESNSVLYDKLIEPIKDKIEKKKSLIILPDEYLFYIPFETLYDNKLAENNTDFREINYLIKSFEIKYNYSVNLWMFNKNFYDTDEKYEGEFLGFAPVFEDEENLLTAELNSTDTTMRTIEINGKRFSELHYSKKEINEISNMFQKHDKITKTFFYDDATEANFKNTVANYKYIHLSTHGFLNKNNSSLPGLAFYYSKDAENKEDGLLYSSEVESLHINADLIVLSSCEGGLGQLVDREGLISISRDFISSGTPNIIYSLWNVQDKNTSEMMIEFYLSFLSGKSYSESLRDVKIKMINDKNTCHPKIWSSFILMGI